MKINYNGFKPMPLEAQDTLCGNVYEYDGHYYARMKLGCGGFNYSLTGNKSIAFYNLSTGSMRLLAKDQEVFPLQAKLQLRQEHTHEETD